MISHIHSGANWYLKCQRDLKLDWPIFIPITNLILAAKMTIGHIGTGPLNRCN